MKKYLLALALLFSACSPAIKIETKEVYIPTKCNLTLPQKPQNKGDIQSAKALAQYYLEVEQIAKDCTKSSNHPKPDAN